MGIKKALRDVTTLNPPTRPTSHVVTPVWTSSLPFDCDVIYGRPLFQIARKIHP